MKGFVQLFKSLFKWSFQNSSQSSFHYSTPYSIVSVVSKVSNKIRYSVLIVLSVLISIALLVGMVGIQPTLAAPIVTPSVKTSLTPSAEKAVLKPIVPKATVSLGEKVFTGNCAACHIGGNNVILAEKNLSKAALEQYAMNSVAAIKTQVTGGKNAMPAFGENLTSAEIEAVARYVITQSQLDWKGSSVGLQ